MTNKTSQKIQIDVSGSTLKFSVAREDYNKYINEMMPNNKIAPGFNFLMRTVDQGSKADLNKVIESNPGAEIHLTQAVLQEYAPDLAVTAKKLSS